MTPLPRDYILTQEQYERIGTDLDNVLPPWRDNKPPQFSKRYTHGLRLCHEGAVLFQYKHDGATVLDAYGNPAVAWKEGIPYVAGHPEFQPVRIQEWIQNLRPPSVSVDI